MDPYEKEARTSQSTVQDVMRRRVRGIRGKVHEPRNIGSLYKPEYLKRWAPKNSRRNITLIP